eukprot:5296910-Prymnesium_polylepis.1
MVRPNCTADTTAKQQRYSSDTAAIQQIQHIQQRYSRDTAAIRAAIQQRYSSDTVITAHIQ